MSFFNISSLPYKTKRERVFVKSITGETVQLCFIRMEQGASTQHAHPQEQIGYILSGSVEVTIDELSRSLGPGDAYHIPSNVPHGFRVTRPDGVEYLEIFSPPKDENRT